LILRNIKVIRIFLIGIIGIFILSNCAKDTTNPSIVPKNPTLDISIYQGDIEAIIGTNVRIAGYLINANQDTMGNEKFFISSYPDSIGILSPNGGIFTDVNSPTGLKDDVIFVGSKLGLVTITGIYRDFQGNIASSDSIKLTIINPNG